MLSNNGRVGSGANSGNMLSSRPIYSFPELKTVEILQCMDDLRIPLAEAELSKPTAAIVQRIFEAFSDIFMGPSGKDQMSTPFSVTTNLEYPDLHVESIGLVAFYRLILRLMLEVGIEDFCLRDLIRPEPVRLRLILSAVINFAKFREEQLTVFEEFSRRAEDASEQRSKLLKREAELVAKLGSIKARRAEEEPASNRLREESARLIQHMRELKKEQSALSNSLDALKARRQEHSEKMAQTQFLLSNVKQECNKLKSRIVHSPEKLLQIIAEMNASINSEKSNLSQLEKKSRELQMKLDALQSLETELQKTLTGMETLAADLSKRDEVHRRLREEREAIERKQIQAKDLTIQETQLARQMHAAQEKLGRLQASQAARRDQISNRLCALQAEYQVAAEERGRVMSKVEQSEKMCKDFELRISELRRSHEAEVAAIRTDSVALKARALAYMSELKKHLKSGS